MTYVIENKTFDEIDVGDTGSVAKTLTEEDIRLFAAASSDINPMHLDPEFAAKTPFKKVIGHGMWTGSLISAVFGTKLPGPGSIYLQQSIKFIKPVYIGDNITAEVVVAEKKPEKKIIVFNCRCFNQQGETVASGVAEVAAPREKIKYEVSAK